MAQTRKKGICSKCKEQREIYDIQNGLCNSCWRSWDRWVKAGGDPRKWRRRFDHQSGIVRCDSDRSLTLYARLVNILTKLGCSERDKDKVMVILDPYFKSAEELFNRPRKLIHRRARKAKNNSRYQKKKALEKPGAPQV